VGQDPAVLVRLPLSDGAALMLAQFDATDGESVRSRGRRATAGQIAEQCLEIDILRDALELPTNLIGQTGDGDAGDSTLPESVESSHCIPHALGVTPALPGRPHIDRLDVAVRRQTEVALVQRAAKAHDVTSTVGEQPDLVVEHALVGHRDARRDACQLDV